MRDRALLLRVGLGREHHVGVLVERVGNEVGEGDHEGGASRARAPRPAGPDGCEPGRPERAAARAGFASRRPRDRGGPGPPATRRPVRVRGSAGNPPRAGRARWWTRAPRSGRRRRCPPTPQRRATASSAATACSPAVAVGEALAPEDHGRPAAAQQLGGAAQRVGAGRRRGRPGRRGRPRRSAPSRDATSAASAAPGREAQHGVGVRVERAGTAASPPPAWPRCAAPPCARAGRGSAPRPPGSCRAPGSRPRSRCPAPRAVRSGRASTRA